MNERGLLRASAKMEAESLGGSEIGVECRGGDHRWEVGAKICASRIERQEQYMSFFIDLTIYILLKQWEISAIAHLEPSHILGPQLTFAQIEANELLDLTICQEVSLSWDDTVLLLRCVRRGSSMIDTQCMKLAALCQCLRLC